MNSLQLTELLQYQVHSGCRHQFVLYDCLPRENEKKIPNVNETVNDLMIFVFVSSFIAYRSINNNNVLTHLTHGFLIPN